MTPVLLTLLLLGTLIALLFTGRQIFVLVGFIGSIAAILLWGKGGADMTFFATYTFLDWYVLVAIPLFIFMGVVIARSGVADDLYTAIYKWMGGMRGGLGIGTIGVCTAIAAMAGSNMTGTVTAGLIGLPPMLKRKYDKRMVTGLIQAGGALGMLIPPSLDFILYGLIAHVSIGHLWIAGILPGILLASMYIVYIAVRCHFQPHMGPAIPVEERVGWRDKFSSLRFGILPLLLIFAILGMLFMGITTLVECSAIAAIGAMVLAAVHRSLTWKLIKDALDETMRVTSMFLWIFVAAILFSSVYDGLGATGAVEQLLVQFENRYVIIAVMMLSWLGLGMVMDDTAMLIIVAPLYIPLVAQLGFSLVWFGVLFVINIQMAVLTPPFGYGLFIMKGIVPKDSGITIVDIYRSVIPYVGIQAVCLAIVIAFPQIALWLPTIWTGGGV